MKTVFSGITMMASLAALALSGLALMKVNTLETDLPEQIVAALPENPVGTAGTAASQGRVSESANAESGRANNRANEPEGIEASVPVPVESLDIQPGQFSQLGYDNQVKMEIVSVKRLPAAEDGSRQRVNINIRVRRMVEEPETPNALVFFSKTQGRNPQTNEVYPAIDKNRTGAIPIRDLSTDAWGEAYAWLDNVPEDLKTMDIVFREMAVFNNVPISD